MRWFWLLCLTIAAISDIKERTVSYGILAVCGICGVIYGCKNGGWDRFLGILIGGGILAVSKATRGAVGTGDGWFFVASAGYLEMKEMWWLLLGGLAVSWFWGAGLILFRAWRGENAGGDTLPFFACIWPAGVWILLQKEGIVRLLS